MSELDVLSKIEVYRGYSQNFIGSIPEIDFLFIDADHSIGGCKRDFIGYSSFIRPGGYIAFHDYYPQRKDLGPTWVVENEVILSNEYEFKELYDSLWIAQKMQFS